MTSKSLPTCQHVLLALARSGTPSACKAEERLLVIGQESVRHSIERRLPAQHRRHVDDLVQEVLIRLSSFIRGPHPLEVDMEALAATIAKCRIATCLRRRHEVSGVDHLDRIQAQVPSPEQAVSDRQQLRLVERIAAGTGGCVLPAKLRNAVAYLIAVETGRHHQGPVPSATQVCRARTALRACNRGR